MSIYQNISDYYDDLFPLDEAALSFALRGAQGAQNILEIGCATGALGEALKEKGCRVVGVDFDRHIIDKAMKRRCIMLEFKAVSPSMLDLNMPSHSFQQVLCFNNTLARLPNEMAITAMIGKIRDFLKPGGVFKGALNNYDYVLEGGLGTPAITETPSVVLKRQYRLEQQFLECYSVLIDKKSDTEQSTCIPLFPIRKAQLEEILEGNGFTQVDFYDDFSGTPYTGGSDTLVFEAR